MAAFVAWEHRAPRPMVRLGLFRVRRFSAANAMTLVVYAALGAILFFVVLQLQTGLGWSPLAAGLATLQVSVCMLLLAVAALPALVGLSGDDDARPDAFTHGYRWALVVCAALLVLGGALWWALVRDPAPSPGEAREG